MPLDLTGYVRVLSIDGGGIRGIIPARVLAALAGGLEKPLAETFHLIAGTSTGGIIACGLCHPTAPMTPAELADLYAARGAEIFKKPWLGSAAKLIGPSYGAGVLEQILKDKLLDTWLSDIKHVELLVPSYGIQLPGPVDIDGNAGKTTRDPMFFQASRAVSSDYDFRLWQVARATSAAPTYFPPAHITDRAGRDYYMVDGGVFANNPAMAAITAAYKLCETKPGFKGVFAVSLGTGSIQDPISGEDAEGWGLLSWLRPLISIMMDGSADTVCHEVDEMLGPENHFRLQIGLVSSKADPVSVDEALDDATSGNIAHLEAKAQELVDSSRADLERLAAALSAPRWEPAEPDTSSV